MRWLHKLRMRLKTLRRTRSGAHLDAELRFHLEEQIAENLAAGMSPEEARRAATLVFGNPSVLREETRATWNWAGAELFLHDLRLLTAGLACLIPAWRASRLNPMQALRSE